MRGRARPPCIETVGHETGLVKSRKIERHLPGMAIPGEIFSAPDHLAGSPRGQWKENGEPARLLLLDAAFGRLIEIDVKMPPAAAGCEFHQQIVVVCIGRRDLNDVDHRPRRIGPLNTR